MRWDAWGAVEAEVGWRSPWRADVRREVGAAGGDQRAFQETGS